MRAVHFAVGLWTTHCWVFFTGIAVAAPVFELRQVAHVGQPSGLGGDFVEFGAPVINEAGLVAFEAGFESGGFLLNYGLLIDTADGPGLPSLVARNGQAAPGTATTFGTNLGFPYLNDAAQVASQVFVNAVGSERSAIYAGSVASLSLLAREGHPAPAGPSGTTWYPLINDSPFPHFNQANNDPGLRLTRRGEVAFGGWLNSGGSGSTLIGGLFIGAPDAAGGSTGSVQKVFVAGDEVPGTGGMTLTATGFVETQLGNPHPYVLNDQGLTLFRAGVENTTSGQFAGYGFFTGSAGGAGLAAVALPGHPAPIGGGVVFGSAQQFGLGINNDGQVAFATALQGPGIVTDVNDSALFAGTPGNLQTIYQENDPIPGTTDGARFASDAGGVTMNAQGRVAFVSQARGGSSAFANDRVLVVGTPQVGGSDYDLTLAARVGDDAGIVGDIYRFTGFFGPTLNADGLLVFFGMARGESTGEFRSGVWGFTESDGHFPILTTGQEVEVAPGVFAGIDAISFVDGAGGEDGRRLGLTDEDALALLLRFPGTRDTPFDYGIYIAAPLPGDYNRDGAVDAADYVVWRKTDGTQEGYSTWRANFGRTAASSAGSLSNGEVPEPATFLMLLTIAPAFVLSTVRTRARLPLLRRSPGRYSPAEQLTRRDDP